MNGLLRKHKWAVRALILALLVLIALLAVWHYGPGNYLFNFNWL